MKAYRSKDPEASVAAYEYGDDYIRVKFRNGSVYKYTYASCGQNHVECMIFAAEMQRGLSTYIDRHFPDFEKEQ